MKSKNDYQRVLVCGGRNYSDACRVGVVLDELTIELIIQGGAGGADALAKEYAITNQVQVQEFKADWNANGRAAGPIRNSKMLIEGKPDVVLAFPGGRGTADMVVKAKRAGVQVLDFRDEGGDRG